jgi:hypothetical protein
MTNALHEAPFQSCPSCGSVLSRRALTCSYCGGVVAIESVSSRLKSELRYQTGRAATALQDRDVLMWVLAFVPLLILPPVLAVLMNLPGRNPEHRANVFVVAIAVCNIILSVLMWRWLSEFSMSSGLSLGLFLKSLGISPPGSPGQSI